MDSVFIVVGVVVVVGVVLLLGRRSSSSSSGMPAGTTDADIRDLAQAGHTIQAIKWYRELHQVGLAEAKSAVEEMM